MGESIMGTGNGWDEHKNLVEYRLNELMTGQKELLEAVQTMNKENVEHRSHCQAKFAEVDKDISNIKTGARMWATGISTGVTGAILFIKQTIWGG